MLWSERHNKIVCLWASHCKCGQHTRVGGLSRLGITRKGVREARVMPTLCEVAKPSHTFYTTHDYCQKERQKTLSSDVRRMTTIEGNDRVIFVS